MLNHTNTAITGFLVYNYIYIYIYICSMSTHDKNDNLDKKKHVERIRAGIHFIHIKYYHNFLLLYSM